MPTQTLTVAVIFSPLFLLPGGSRVWGLGCCGGRWKGGLPLGPTPPPPPSGRDSTQCAAHTTRFGQQLFLGDEIIICARHGWKSIPHPHPHPRRTLFYTRKTPPPVVEGTERSPVVQLAGSSLFASEISMPLLAERLLYRVQLCTLLLSG